jgi:hypothetical protein
MMYNFKLVPKTYKYYRIFRLFVKKKELPMLCYIDTFVYTIPSI